MSYDLGDGITLHTRDEWAQGRAIFGDHDSRTIESIDTLIVHRTMGNRLGDTDPAQWIRNLYDFHTAELHYADIAYEIVVDERGDLWACRPLTLWSAAQRGHNPTSVAVAVLGGAALVLPSLRKAFELVSYAAGHELTQRVHSDVAAVPCPGDGIRAWVHSGGFTAAKPKKEIPVTAPIVPPTPPVPPLPPVPLEPVFKPYVPAGGISAGVIARIRTLVPTLIGVVLAFLQHRYGIVVTLDPGVTALLVLLVSMGYYDLVRRLEAWKPELGWLLGYPSPPKYEQAA